ncbi:hypothetical protein P4S73_04800 [Paraglaciecola sp. Hal342]
MQETEILNTFVSECDTGAFAKKVEACLREVAAGISKTDKPGKLVLQFDIKPKKASNQNGASVKVNVTSKLTYTKPTFNGKVNEENTTETPMHINKDGSISLLASSHDDMFNDKVSTIGQK